VLAPSKPRLPVRRTLRAVSTVLILAGSLLLLDAGLTLAWQEPVSALYAKITQDRLGGELKTLEEAAPTPVERRVLRSLKTRAHRTAFLARSLKRRRDEGEAAGRIWIPSIGAKWVVVDGTDPGSLRNGPGFFPQSPWPGARGTVAIAGHRTTYAAPFRNLDDLERGNRVVIEMPYGKFTYRVERTRIVKPDALWVIQRTGYDRLVLSACHPKHSAAKRIVTFARLISSEPRGAALDA
jgi:sortase A